MFQLGQEHCKIIAHFCLNITASVSFGSSINLGILWGGNCRPNLIFIKVLALLMPIHQKYDENCTFHADQHQPRIGYSLTDLWYDAMRCRCNVIFNKKSLFFFVSKRNQLQILTHQWIASPNSKCEIWWCESVVMNTAI